MKAFISTCLLAITAAKPQIYIPNGDNSYLGDSLVQGHYTAVDTSEVSTVKPEHYPAGGRPQIYPPLLDGDYSYFGDSLVQGHYTPVDTTEVSTVKPEHSPAGGRPQIYPPTLDGDYSYGDSLAQGHYMPVATAEVSTDKPEHSTAGPKARAIVTRAIAYYDQPAFNRNGTLAYTPQIQQANAVHNAAYQLAYQTPSQSTYNPTPYESTHYNPNPSHQNYKPQPPAPLNADGTVAHTDEYRAIAAAYQKVFEAAARLAAAHPDRTSPSSADYNPSQNGQYSPQSYDNGQNNAGGNNLAISQHEYNPAPYNPAPSQQTYNSALYKLTPYKPNPSYKNYKPQPPAPLNADGTVAHTDEYRAIAATHQKVFETAASLAAAHPDRTSPSSADYNPSQNGQYSPQSYDNGQNNAGGNNLAISQHEYNPAPYNPAPSQQTYNSALYKLTPYKPNPSYKNYKPQPPAPLNADGTVAHTDEYRAIAATHQKVFETALRIAAAHPDRTSPSSADNNSSQNGQYSPESYDNGHYNPAWNNPALSQHEHNPAPYNPSKV